MPSRELWNKIKELMTEYEKGFGDEKQTDAQKAQGDKDQDDGGQESLSDMTPEIESFESENDKGSDPDEADGKEKKKAKIAMYGAKLKKMGY